MSASRDILVVGSVALDSVKTPFGEVVEGLGGSASYFSISASHFAPVRMVAVVGDDFPGRHRETFDRHRIDLSGLEVSAGRTFRWRGEYNAELGHAHTLETQLNVFSRIRVVASRALYAPVDAGLLIPMSLISRKNPFMLPNELLNCAGPISGENFVAPPLHARG